MDEEVELKDYHQYGDIKPLGANFLGCSLYSNPQCSERYMFRWNAYFHNYFDVIFRSSDAELRVYGDSFLHWLHMFSVYPISFALSGLL